MREEEAYLVEEEVREQVSLVCSHHFQKQEFHSHHVSSVPS